MTQPYQHQHQQQPHIALPSPDARLFAVEKDVADLKEGMTVLGANMDRGFRDLAADLKARGSINWTPIGILLGVLGSLGTMGFTWINTGQGRLEALIAKQEIRAERFVPREDLDTRFMVLGQRRDDAQRFDNARFERLERDVEAAQKAIVPRGEHDTIRQLQQRDYDLLRNRIERVEGRFEKRTDGLGRDIERLSEHTLSRTEALARNDAQDRVTGMVRGELDEHVRAFNDRQQRTIDRLDMPPRR